MNVLACSASSKDLFFLFFLICVPLAILRDHEPFNLLDPLTLRLHTRHSQNCKLVTTKFSPQPTTHWKCHNCSQVNSLEFVYIWCNQICLSTPLFSMPPIHVNCLESYLFYSIGPSKTFVNMSHSSLFVVMFVIFSKFDSLIAWNNKKRGFVLHQWLFLHPFYFHVSDFVEFNVITVNYIPYIMHPKWCSHLNALVVLVDFTWHGNNTSSLM